MQGNERKLVVGRIVGSVVSIKENLHLLPFGSNGGFKSSGLAERFVSGDNDTLVSADSYRMWVSAYLSDSSSATPI